ncbi:hypothetical protein KS2013_453 [Kangiella sediminilitoris]|uniref:Uncharacterized protein n=1 Tax=Kangiella sediminilitoris TaxID=1144748 RepID=A0A1B3B8Q3_9GAMM|nr:hypothetical protein KS2013_453 [Kangiella sediminilitoris]
MPWEEVILGKKLHPHTITDTMRAILVIHPTGAQFAE